MTTRYNTVHEQSQLKGPGDSRPTAQQIISDNNLEGKLTNTVILITGTSSGIGIPTVAALKTTGAKIYATARNLTKGRAALAHLLEPNRVELLELDTADLSSVRRCAATFLAREPKLHILINNAGVMAIAERRTTVDGHEEQFAANYLGHFLLFQLLKPALLAGATPKMGARVVNVSSSGHKVGPVWMEDLGFEEPGSYEPWRAYGSAKTAEILMTNEIERRYGGRGLHGIALNPGGIDTALQVHVQAMIDEFKKNPEVVRMMKSVEQGAATTLVAVVDRDTEGKGGFYLNDCAVQEITEDKQLGGGGLAPHAVDEMAAKKLWEKSLVLVGVEGDA